MSQVELSLFQEVLLMMYIWVLYSAEAAPYWWNN